MNRSTNTIHYFEDVEPPTRSEQTVTVTSACGASSHTLTFRQYHAWRATARSHDNTPPADSAVCNACLTVMGAER